MRIISGELKGKKILIPEDKSTRPLKDMVKESIFNIIEHSTKFSLKIFNSNVLDLFSGTGSFGIECLSRGAANVIFFENYMNSLKILKKNIFNLKLENKSTVYNCSAYNIEYSNLKIKIFDIIFLDPPFKTNEIKRLIDQLKRLKVADTSSLIIIHRNKKSDDNLSDYLNILEVKNYGLSKIFFCKLN
ncbi:16S rRNA (guanine(966)-N(2))-methyltransferase RsmD [Candidatus Pelagibacter sp.]|nr:16S rRNA (guanine(966)-N(2))-methyltransferase RsmD [Candidatus Pelagibacter sp.]